jgi:hypothetical protein
MAITPGPPTVTVEELSASDELELGKTHLGKPAHTELQENINLFIGLFKLLLTSN